MKISERYHLQCNLESVVFVKGLMNRPVECNRECKHRPRAKIDTLPTLS